MRPPILSEQPGCGKKPVMNPGRSGDSSSRVRIADLRIIVKLQGGEVMRWLERDLPV